jgi:hypothetical protein
MTMGSLLGLALLAGIPGLDEILDRHEAGLAKIHAIQATLEMSHSEDGGSTWIPGGQIDFARQGPIEWVHEHNRLRSDGSKMVPVSTHTIMKFEPDVRYSVGNIDPDNPPSEPISVSETYADGPPLGALAPGRPFGPYGYDQGPGPLLLFLPAANLSLRQIVDATPGTAPPSSRLVDQKNARFR